MSADTTTLTIHRPDGSRELVDVARVEWTSNGVDAWMPGTRPEDGPKAWGDGCECWVTPESQHYVYNGVTEPGSAIEFNPDCPKHGHDKATTAPEGAKEQA